MSVSDWITLYNKQSSTIRHNDNNIAIIHYIVNMSTIIPKSNQVITVKEVYFMYLLWVYMTMLLHIIKA